MSEKESNDVEFGTSAMKFWGLKNDPFKPTPLNFKNPLHYEYFVKTRTINALKDVKKQFLADSDSRIILLLGSRGTGKTTSMKYLSSIMSKEDEGAAFIECSINANLDDFRKTVHWSIFKAMRTYLIKNNKLTNEQMSYLYKISFQDNVIAIEDGIEQLSEIVCSHYTKRILFLDNLDKATDTNLFQTIQKYFRTQQMFYEKLLEMDNIYIIIALLPIFRDLLTNQEVNFLAGNVIRVRPWTETELDSLFKRRLKASFIKKMKEKENENEDPEKENEKDLLRLNNIIETKARTLIYLNNDYNPRWALLAFKKVLTRYYEIYLYKKANESVPKYKSNTKLDNPDGVDTLKEPLVTHRFCHTFSREVQATKNQPIPKIDFDIVDVYGRNKFKNAYNKIKNILLQFKDVRLEIIETMIEVHSHEEIQDQLSLNKLMGIGMIQRSQDRYIFTPDVTRLFDYLYDGVNKNYSYLRYYFVHYLT